MSRSARWFFGIFFLLVVFAAVVFYLSTTIVDRISVSGNHHYSRSEILEFTGFSDSDSMLDILLNRKRVIENQGYINRLEVVTSSFRTLEITVYEKEVVGYIAYMGEYICIDREGYIIDYTSQLDEGKPRITGLELSSFTVYEPLDVSEKVVDAIEAIYSTALSFDIPIDWIDLKYKDGSDISLLIGGLDVRIGDITRLEDKFEALSEILKMLPEDEEGILFVEDVDHDIIFREDHK